ncbi:LysR family transcriptional regulator [Neobacillus sp. NRS-1170]|uniref:LysR family transcriptional regulator n=1 Tax=Neobacillus sp. NRS-1170 TaxID=3233898 RepID=UPI003D2D031F
MEFLQLKYFQTAARYEHITKAAEELRIAQPSLSKTIARLEEDLGVQLFDRQGRNIQLNACGRAFLEHVNRAFMELDNGIKKVKDLAGMKKVSISIAMTLPKILPKLLSPFLNQYPHVHFRQIMEPPSILKRKLEDGEIDLCISPVPFGSPAIEWKPLFTDDIYLIVPTDHYLAGRKSIHISEIKNESFILMNTGFSIRDLVDKLFNEAGFTPEIIMEVNDPETIIGMIRRGKGVTFISKRDWQYVSHLIPEKIRINDPNWHQMIGLSWSTKKDLSIEAYHFKQYVIEFFEKT